MAPKQESSKAEVEHKTKKFGKAERKVPHHTQKAKKFYPAEDEAKPKKVCEGRLHLDSLRLEILRHAFLVIRQCC